jgi:hypothetical protein
MPETDEGTLGFLTLLLSYVHWLHATFVAPVVRWWQFTVLGVLEESISSVIREALALTQRSINGASAWTLSGEARTVCCIITPTAPC